MDKEKREKVPKQLGKAAAEPSDRENQMPVPNRRKESREARMMTPEMESGGEGSEESDEEEDSRVGENSKAIKKLSKQLVDIQRATQKVLASLPQQKGR